MHPVWSSSPIIKLGNTCIAVPPDTPIYSFGTNSTSFQAYWKAFAFSGASKTSTVDESKAVAPTIKA